MCHRVTTIANDGLIRYFWFFNIERLIVTSDRGLAEVLVTKSYQFKRPDIVRKLIEPAVGLGILLTEGEVHKIQRRNLMPAFSFRHVKDLYPIFWQKSREVVQAMTATADADGVAELLVADWASRGTLDIIGTAGMGVEFRSIQDPSNPLVMTYKSFTERRQSIIMGLLLFVLPTRVLRSIPTAGNAAIKKATGTIRGVCQDMIDAKRRKIANKERLDLDILSVALESGLFSDENLVDQLMTFLAAGHETTAAALTWAVYLLSCHPEAQTRLRQEIRGKLPPLDSGADITSADIDKLPYLNAVCNEVLRVYSPVPRTSREAIEDTTIDGQHVPKGTVLMISPWGTNVDVKQWGSDAADFRPERWLLPPGTTAGDEDAGKKAAAGGAANNYAFLTFLHGPRSCIGASFARGEFACLLAAWIGRFEFELRDKAMLDRAKLTIRYAVTAKPKGGLPVRARVIPGF